MRVKEKHRKKMRGKKVPSSRRTRVNLLRMRKHLHLHPLIKETFQTSIGRRAQQMLHWIESSSWIPLGYLPVHLTLFPRLLFECQQPLSDRRIRRPNNRRRVPSRLEFVENSKLLNIILRIRRISNRFINIVSRDVYIHTMNIIIREITKDFCW